MATISLCMIVRDEENLLARCLNSVKDIVDEIIIVDTGSVDRTKEIAARFDAVIKEFLWCDDFAAARNYAFSFASSDYILWLDADDVLPVKSGERLNRWKSEKERPAAVMTPYQVAFDEEDRCLMYYYRERLLRRDKGFLWQGAVHEVIPVYGDIRFADIPVEHRPTEHGRRLRNLKIYASLEKKRELTARERYYFSREAAEARDYAGAIKSAEVFLDMAEGWVEDKKAACLLLANCYQAIGKEKQRHHALMRYMEFDAPGADLCCAMGSRYFDSGCIKTAIFWYQAALAAEKPRDGFIFEDDYGFLPCIWLCVCYDRLGDRETALSWHKRAKAYRPQHRAVVQNEEYFASLLEGSSESDRR